MNQISFIINNYFDDIIILDYNITFELNLNNEKIQLNFTYDKEKLMEAYNYFTKTKHLYLDIQKQDTNIVLSIYEDIVNIILYNKDNSITLEINKKISTDIIDELSDELFNNLSLL